MSKKTLFSILTLALAILSCSKEYDDSFLKGELGNVKDKVEDIDKRIKEIEQVAQQLNKDLSALSAIVKAIRERDYIVRVENLVEEDKQKGYVIHFSNQSSIIVKHGERGEKGDANHSIGIKKNSDGLYYWTLNGEVIIKDNKKLKVEHNIGIGGENTTPKIKVAEEYLEASFDNGKTWNKLSKDQPNIKIVEVDNTNKDFVKFTLNDGTELNVQKKSSFVFSLHNNKEVIVLPNQSYDIPYTINDDEAEIEVVTKEGYTAKVVAKDNTSGVIRISTPNKTVDTRILVHAILKSGLTYTQIISITNTVLDISSKNFNLQKGSSIIEIPISTNIDYNINIPEEAKSWISILEGTRAEIRKETIRLRIEENTGLLARSATINITENNGIIIETVTINQAGKQVVSPINVGLINVSFEGTLNTKLQHIDKNRIVELAIRGELNEVDYNFIKNSLPNLVTLNLREVKNIDKLTNILANTSIEAIYLPKELRYLPSNAFDGYSNLKAVSLPENLQYISDSVFYNCERLRSISIPPTVRYISNNAFEKCKSLEVMNIPNGVSGFGSEVFRGCENLRTVRLPESLKNLPNYTFTNCKNLISVNIPSGIKEIGSSVFDGCERLREIHIPTSVQKIERYAFFGCKALETISIPDNVTEIEMNTFDNCERLRSIKLPKNLRKIEGYAFSGCKALETISIPDNVTEIEKLTFYNCEKLRSIKLPKNLRKIGEYAFDGCKALETISIPDNVTEIEKGTFFNCEKLKNIKLPNNLRKIGNYAFGGCINLIEIEIPSNVNEIGEGIFRACYELEKIRMKGTTPPKFSKENYSVTLYVPIGTKQKYIDAGYDAFREIIEE